VVFVRFTVRGTQPPAGAGVKVGLGIRIDVNRLLESIPTARGGLDGYQLNGIGAKGRIGVGRACSCTGGATVAEVPLIAIGAGGGIGESYGHAFASQGERRKVRQDLRVHHDRVLEAILAALVCDNDKLDGVSLRGSGAGVVVNNGTGRGIAGIFYAVSVIPDVGIAG